MIIKFLSKVKPFFIPLVFVFCGLFIYYHYINIKVDIPTKEYTKATIPKEIQKISKETIAIKAIKVYNKKDISKKIKLPKDIAEDEKEQVISAVKVKPHGGETSVVTTVNVETGESNTITRQEPPKLFSLKQEIEIGMRYGYTTQGREVTIYGKYSPIRIGKFQVGVYGEVNTRNVAKIMADISYKF